MIKNNIGIIGFGNVGKKHYLEFLKNKDYFKVKAICDFDEKKVRYLKKKFSHLKIYKKAEDLINDGEINTISICSYDHFHYDQMNKCFKKNKNVFCEKPICFNYQEFFKLSKSLFKFKGYLGTNFNLRTAESFKVLKKKIMKKELGKIFHVEAGYESGRLFKIKDGWRGKNKNYSLVHGGMIHMIDLVMWILNFFGQKRDYEIFTQGNNICSEHFNYKNHDFITSSVKSKKLLINFKASWGCVTPHFHSLKIYGTKGTYINDFRYKGYFLKKLKLKFKKDIFNYEDRNRGETIKEFLEQIRQRKLMNKKKREILKTTELSMAIQESLLKKKRIKVNL